MLILFKLRYEENNIQCLYVTDEDILKNNFFKNTVLNIISKKPLEIKILNAKVMDKCAPE